MKKKMGLEWGLYKKGCEEIENIEKRINFAKSEEIRRNEIFERLNVAEIFIF